MSRVTGIVIVYSGADHRVVKAISDRLVANKWPPLAPDCSNALITGGKHPQFGLRGTGINYFGTGIAQLVEDFLTADWIMPENAILLIQPEDEPMQVHRPPYLGMR